MKERACTTKYSKKIATAIGALKPGSSWSDIGEYIMNYKVGKDQTSLSCLYLALKAGVFALQYILIRIKNNVS